MNTDTTNSTATTTFFSAKLLGCWALGAALGNALALHIYRREGVAAKERAEALITLCTEQGTPSF